MTLSSIILPDLEIFLYVQKRSNPSKVEDRYPERVPDHCGCTNLCGSRQLFTTLAEGIVIETNPVSQTMRLAGDPNHQVRLPSNS
jgi:hypothetical protein